MSKMVSDFLIERLSNWGVKKIFGYPGDGINGIMGAMDRADASPHKIKLIQVRHEENAAFMTCGFAKFTGEVGACMATSGPGAIHLLHGLYDAKMDHQPRCSRPRDLKSFSPNEYFVVEDPYMTSAC